MTDRDWKMVLVGFFLGLLFIMGFAVTDHWVSRGPSAPAERQNGGVAKP